MNGATPPVGRTATGSAGTLQPWIDVCDIAYLNNISVPLLQPCVSTAGSNVSCFDICQNNSENIIEIIFDPTISSNLINCGLWRTASTSMALGGEFRDQWLQPFNVETFRSIGFDFPQANCSDTFIYDDVPDLAGWAECFRELWALVYPNQPIFYQTTDATSIPTVCDSELIFGRQNW